MCVLMGKGFIQSSLHSATGYTKMIVMSAALWSVLMELHEGSSMMDTADDCIISLILKRYVEFVGQ